MISMAKGDTWMRGQSLYNKPKLEVTIGLWEVLEDQLRMTHTFHVCGRTYINIHKYI